MRRIRKEELKELSNFMVAQFFEGEQMQKMFLGINQERAKEFAVQLVYIDLEYFFKYGDIFIYDDNIVGAIVGIEYNKVSLLKKIPFHFKGNKILSKMSKEEIQKIKENSKIINEVHNAKWCKKYCKNPYYIIQFAIDKEKRGNGIAREMMEYLFNYVNNQNGYIVLETLKSENVPIYEHFGFEIKETFETKNKQLKEYRMIRS